MKEIFINVDSYNNENIKTIQGNNNAEIYKICISKSKVRLSLVGKTVKLGYVMAGTTKGDIIEDLNITNAEQGEITFPITNRISKQDGVYSCQLAIYGADEFLEYTATFGLTVEDNIFTKIAGEIENSKDLTYIERILEEAKTVSGDLKTNIPVATNLNSSLESNISNARNINTTLSDTTEKSKVAATDAIEKKSQLEKSITKAKEFIDGLDGSQDIPGIRMELTELQNGLKSNQALEYSGSSITANDTLEGRTEGMRIKGRTLNNLIKDGKGTFVIDKSQSESSRIKDFKTIYPLQKNKEYVGYLIVNNIENTEKWLSIYGYKRGENGGVYGVLKKETKLGVVKFKWTPNNGDIDIFDTVGVYLESPDFNNGAKATFSDFMLFEEGADLTYIDEYFEGLKSFGEAEQVGDKYKISILSSNAIKIIGKYVNYANDGLQGDSYQSYVIKCDGVKNIAINLKDEEINRFGVECWKSDNFKNQQDFVGNLNYFTNKFTKQIFSPLEGTKYIKIYLSNNMPIATKKFSIEVFVDSFPNEGYREDKKDILIKEPLREGDYLYEDNEQVKVYRDGGKYVFTGNENMYIEETIAANNIKFVITTEGTDIKPAGKVICNKFIQGNDTIANSVRLGTSNKVVINIQSSTLESPNMGGFRKWLKDNPTEIIYQLATPTVEVVENCVDIDLDTFIEKTYFNILNSLPGTLDFKVPSNIGSVVQNMAKEVNNIWDVINNLLVPSIVKANGNLAMLKLNNNLN